MVETKCAAEVPDRSTRWPRYIQCGRNRGHGPGGKYCKQHAVKFLDATETWYRVNGETVHPVNVVKSTAATITIKDGDHVRTEQKHSSYYNYLPTEREAVDYIRNRLQDDVDNAERNLGFAKRRQEMFNNEHPE